MRTFLFLFVLYHTVNAQVNVEIKIVNAVANTTLQQNNLNQQLQTQNLSTVEVVSSSSGTELGIQQCPTGTYAEGASTVCEKCAAGTASPVLGATTRFSCQTCFPGTWSLQQASTCTNCPAVTFSPNAGAPSQSSCLACPPNSYSNAGTDLIAKCSCNDRYFIPTNTLQELDPSSTTQFGSWTTLALNVFLINQAHVAC
jgi:hypothetical protein